MPRDAVSRTANVERTGRHKWVNVTEYAIGFWGAVYCLLFVYFLMGTLLRKGGGLHVRH